MGPGNAYMTQPMAAWWHQAITWNNVHISLAEICEIHLTAISHDINVLKEFENALQHCCHISKELMGPHI